MQKKVETAEPDTEYDEELHDTLIAISVVAKRLATNMNKNTKMNKNKEDKDVQGLRTDRTNSQS